MPIFSIYQRLQSGAFKVLRLATWAVVICACVFALAAGALRFVVLPHIGDYRDTIARELGAATKHEIAIGNLEARWSGLNLQLTLGDVAVLDRARQPALKFGRIDGTLSWWSLLHWEPRFDVLEIERPDLNIKRDERGVISVAGIALNYDPQSGLSEWLLRQGNVVIRDAGIGWLDQMRGAPVLRLEHVDFKLESRGRTHRFGLRAVPPAELATPLDVRGVLEGRTFADFERGNAQLYAQFDHTDIAAWRPWIEFPVSLQRGSGALRIWVTQKSGKLDQITADVQLAQVQTKLGAELPELVLDALKGRLVWKALSGGFELVTTQLGLTTHDRIALQPSDTLARVYYDDAPGGARGEFRASLLELEPLRMVADHLPLPIELRQALVRYAPRGSVHELTVKWKGAYTALEQYSVAGRFDKVGVNAIGGMPGFANVSGRIDGDDRSGTLYLDAKRATAELPSVFSDKLDFDTLTAQVGWRKNQGRYEIKLNNIAFSNADVAGSLFGTYRTVPDKRGVIDLTGALTRADARNVRRYIPLQVGEHARGWLNTAFLAGGSNNVKLRLQGDLEDFPFREGKRGLFEVTAHVTGGVLDYVPGWPKIEGLDGDLDFRGVRMDVTARAGRIFGARLARVRAELPDLTAPNRLLTVSGEAEGATAEFLNFIERSPVTQLIDGFTTDVRAQGSGRLALRLAIPLSNPQDTKLSGAYTFVSNLIEADDAPFALEQVNGRLDFTEATVRVANATMTVLGGPATLSASAQPDGATRMNIAGRVNIDNVRRASELSWLQHLRGATDWRAAVTLRKRDADIVFDSTLLGLGSELPAPLAKGAAESLPLHVERHLVSGQQDRISLALDNVVSAQLQRRKQGAQYGIERATVMLGSATAPAPDRNGVWVRGALPVLDLDRWLALYRALPAGASRMDLAGLDVKIGTLDFFGRHFSELAISGSAQGGNWQSVQLAGREVAGDVSWRPQGKGRITAHLKTLTIPAALAGRAAAPREAAEQPLEFPALDIQAERFQLNEKVLGRLEVSALPEGRDWRIERLRITNPEATLNIDGLWQGWLTQPRTQVNLKLEVNDIGKLLTRMGYPEGVRRGTAKLEGPLSWAGSPAQVDFATLTGNLQLQAYKGQFVKLDPGVGKLLGILSLQSLPRRLTLDFRDIFSEGLAFEEIAGAFSVNHGIGTTQDFSIQGPAARILMSGEVNLNAETQKLRVKVYPSVSDSVAVAGALLGGPVAGIASFLVQKVLRDPFDKMTAYEYDITGTWSDPQVSKAGTAPAGGSKEPAAER